jgi:hypothetical protein
MEFRVAEVDGRPTAVFDGEDPQRNSLLSCFLASSKHFVVDILHDISLVERDIYPSHGFENPDVFIEIFKDHVTIEPYIAEHETVIPKVKISLEHAKLLLLEWGVVLQRWRMKPGQA